MTACAECRFFRPSTASPERYGECRRHAPRPEVSGAQHFNWPAVSVEDDCGEFSPRDLPPMQPIELRAEPAAEFFEWLKDRIAICGHGQVSVTCGPCMAPWLQR